MSPISDLYKHHILQSLHAATKAILIIFFILFFNFISIRLFFFIIYHKHNACVPESRYKNLGELFSCHTYRNGRKHTLFSIQITIFASTSFLGGLWNGRYEMHQPNVNRPFLSIHIIVYFISYYTLLSDHLYSHPLPRLFLFVHLPICHKHNDLTHTCREVRRSD